MNQYIAEYPPDVTFRADYRKFFEDLYELSDDPSAHDKYVEQFTSDATVIMGSKKAVGSSGNCASYLIK